MLTNQHNHSICLFVSSVTENTTSVRVGFRAVRIAASIFRAGWMMYKQPNLSSVVYVCLCYSIFSLMVHVCFQVVTLSSLDNVSKGIMFSGCPSNAFIQLSVCSSRQIVLP